MCGRTETTVFTWGFSWVKGIHPEIDGGHHFSRLLRGTPSTKHGFINAPIWTIQINLNAFHLYIYIYVCVICMYVCVWTHWRVLVTCYSSPKKLCRKVMYPPCCRRWYSAAEGLRGSRGPGFSWKHRDCSRNNGRILLATWEYIYIYGLIWMRG